MKRVSALVSLLVVLAAPAAEAATVSFRGYVCTIDCASSAAGYNWAKALELSDPLKCGGNGRDFAEGCVAYVRRQLSAAGAQH